MVRRKIAPVLIILALTTSAAAQDGYKGKEFWLVFPQNARSGETQSALQQYVLITGASGTTGTARNTSTGKTHDFRIETMGFVKVSFDTIGIVAEGKHTNTWHITTDDNVSILAMSHRKASTDSYMLLPFDRLGNEYAIIGYDPLQSGDIFSTQCDFIATEDQTSVKLEYPPSIGLETQTIVLNRGEAMHYSSRNISGKLRDLTGSIVTSDKPIAFFTGHACAQVPSYVNFCDFLIEMLPPVGDLGMDHIVPKLIDQEYSSIRVLAINDATEVKVNSGRTAILKRGQYYQNDSIAASVRVVTSKPAYVMQYGQSADANEDKVADPFMVIVAPLNKGVSQLEITVPQFAKEHFTTWEHFINIVTTREGVDDLKAEPAIAFQKFFKQLGSSDMYVAAIPLSSVQYKLRSETPFIVYQYGYSDGLYDSYGHLCGMK